MKRLSELNEHKEEPEEPWWYECKYEVEAKLCQDQTTSQDNIRDKIETYIKNYFATRGVAGGSSATLADEIEKEMKNISFDQTPPSYRAAMATKRESEKENPENKYIRLR